MSGLLTPTIDPLARYLDPDPQGDSRTQQQDHCDGGREDKEQRHHDAPAASAGMAAQPCRSM
jgi:hypothetical protein